MARFRQREGVGAKFSILEPNPTDWTGVAAGVLAWILMLGLWAAFGLTAKNGLLIAPVGALVTSYFVLSAVRGSHVRRAHLEVDVGRLVVVHDGALCRAMSIPAQEISRIELFEDGDAEDREDVYWPVPTIGAFEPNLAIFSIAPMRFPLRSLMNRFRLESPERPGETVGRLERIGGIGLTLNDPQGAAAAIRALQPSSAVLEVHDGDVQESRLTPLATLSP